MELVTLANSMEKLKHERDGIEIEKTQVGKLMLTLTAVVNAVLWDITSYCFLYIAGIL